MSSEQASLPPDSPTSTARLWPITVAVSFMLLTIYPMVTNRSDSFPLSTYPMFAQPRGNPELVKLVAITETGEQVAVPPHLLGTNEVLQAKAQLNQVAQRNSKARGRFCEAVAARVAADPNTTWLELRLQRARFNPIEYFENGRRPLRLEVLSSCPVRPTAAGETRAGGSADD